MNDLSARIEILFYNLARDNFRVELCDGFHKNCTIIMALTMKVEFYPVCCELFFVKTLKSANIYFVDMNFCNGQASKNQKSRKRKLLNQQAYEQNRANSPRIIDKMKVYMLLNNAIKAKFKNSLEFKLNIRSAVFRNFPTF